MGFGVIRVPRCFIRRKVRGKIGNQKVSVATLEFNPRGSRPSSNIIHFFFRRHICKAGHSSREARANSSRRPSLNRVTCNCINATTLVSTTLGLDPRDAITESQFEDVCVILLDIITSVDDLDLCHQVIDTSTLAVEKSRKNLLNSTLGVGDEESNIPESSVTRLLNILKVLNLRIDPISSSPAKCDASHDHGDHDHGHDLAEKTAALVVQGQCLSVDSLRYYMGLESTQNFPVSSIPELASLVSYLVYDESDVKDKCRLLPQPQQFFSAIFSQYSSQGQPMGADGLKSLMTKMGIGKDAASSAPDSGHEGHDHEGHNHAGHDHRRKRRSVDSQLSNGQRRKKRQAAALPTSMTTCYSAEQLMALYDSPASVDQAAFQQMCPALVSQALFADCSSVTQAAHSDDDGSVSDAEKYGYGTLSIFIICLCAVFGAIFLPCASTRSYKGLMAIFLGLAVGTLFADAVLHLIPMAMGVHVHGDHDGHDHGSGKIIVEDHVRFGLAILGGLYAFYLLELFMSRVGGHSHNTDSETEMSHMDSPYNGSKYNLGFVEDGNGELEHKSSGPNFSPVGKCLV
ncbi:zinc transporter ZIP12 [Elysia marginata]|uniref:Zinc transporter ZIP12 n=1 Tax=Elysia marginata TaxID=1093978 RepID=A0AAV4IND3_9GAST|nr:zinc transporter ZIP12 [Elysia marginata]